MSRPHSVVDGWYAQYRRDFMPFVRFRREEEVVEKHGVVLFSDLVQVGRGKVTRKACGTFLRSFGCLQWEKHANKKALVWNITNSCDKASCPKCYFFGWAVREARGIFSRVSMYEEVSGLEGEHIVVSLPKSDYGLSFEDAKNKVLGLLFAYDVVGGFYIPHRNRVNRATREEYFAPHFHIIGFLKNGYSCRGCEFLGFKGTDRFCVKEGHCDGFEQINRRLGKGNGYIVKVMDKRRSIFGTGWYQLNHSAMNPFDKGSHVGSWFGVVAQKRFRGKRVKVKSMCPEPQCGSPMGFVRFVGVGSFDTSVRKGYYEPLEEGRPAFEYVVDDKEE